MKVFTQNSRCPSQVLFAFDEVANVNVRKVRWAVAYSTRRGCERLVNRISGRIGVRRWNSIEKQFITSLDYGLTDPSALDFLMGLPEAEVCIANPNVIDRPGFLPDHAYHPKLYLFDSTASTGFVVGSANLTESALVANAEVVVTGTEVPANQTWGNVWDELHFSTAPLTTELLEEYRARWVRPQRRPVEPEQSPPAVVITPREKPIFGDEITTGRVTPANFKHFWVEAGSMSSGGSHNQLELPRGANRFFGFSHADYGDDHITIGHPHLTLRGQRWNNRPLTWHGNNRMERLNLPTQAQGGFQYQHTAVLFRQHVGGFEINAVPWEDDEAVAWRAASEALNAVFRIGRGQRICGLF